MRHAKLFLRHEGLPLLALIALPLAYFWNVTLGRSIPISGDIFSSFYPWATVLARAYQAGGLPLWTNGMLAGFPLYAEGEVAALYPPNLLLYHLVSPQMAIAYGLLLHLAWVGCGMYLLARVLGLTRGPALLGGIAVTFSGFMMSHVAHPPIVAACSWLPWIILFHLKLQVSLARSERAAGGWFALTALALAMQYLCGSIQIAFLNTLAFVAFGVGHRWFSSEPSLRRQSLASHGKGLVVDLLLPLLLGGALAAVQLVPTFELSSFSVRQEGIGSAEFLYYSLPPAGLLQFFYPFASGPATEANLEVYGYFGVGTLVLALTAVVVRRDRTALFLAIGGLIAASLSLGGSNPVYPLLYKLPFFNSFRMSARYMWLFIVPAILLAGFGFQSLVDASRERRRKALPPLIVVSAIALAVCGVLVLVLHSPADSWLERFHLLVPVLLLMIAAAAVLPSRLRLGATAFQAALLLLAAIDLTTYAYGMFSEVFAPVPPASYDQVPASVQALKSELSTTRVFSREVEDPGFAPKSIHPLIAAASGALFPNTALVYGLNSAQGHNSLAYSRQSALLGGLSPTALNLLGAGYYFIAQDVPGANPPQEPPASVALTATDGLLQIQPQSVRGIRIASFTEGTDRQPQGTLAGEIVLHWDDGTTERLSLRLGEETGDWDYERTSPGYARPPVAHSFSTEWSGSNNAFAGHTYLWQPELAGAEDRRLVGVEVRSVLAEGRFVLERLDLLEDSAEVTLASLAGRDDFKLAYRSDKALAWKNQNALPRAFIVHQAQVANDATVLERIQENQLDPAREVLLADAPAQAGQAGSAKGDQAQIAEDEPERVQLDVNASSPGYLVLADSWYPGWEVTVDGHPAVIRRADLAFRAVEIGAGQHSVTFEYHPRSLLVGAAISLSALLAMLAAAFVIGFRSRRI